MRFVFILLTVFLTACGSAALPTIKPYKLDVQQGNVVNSKMLLQLRPGMTKSQVRFIMGTPLVQDSFHGNRWDYAYQLREAGKLTAQRRVILDFENELLKTVRGDVIASTGEQADAETANIGTRVIEPPAKAEEKGLLDKLNFWGKDKAELTKEAADIKAKSATESARKVAPVAAERAIPAVQSVLAVPLAVQPVLDSAADMSAAVPDALPAAPIASTESVVSPLSETLSLTSVDTEAVPSQTAVEVTKPREEATPSYESSSGMHFDRTLKFSLENIAPANSNKAVSPRVGNTTIPTPKVLPAATEAGMFDRMLEKIGF
jgi:outer membrane protein assembly factor BamE